MRCSRLTTGGFVCGDFGPAVYVRCVACGWAGTKLCDGPAPEGSGRETCDAGLCRGCTVRDGERDLCPACARLGK